MQFRLNSTCLLLPFERMLPVLTFSHWQNQVLEGTNFSNWFQHALTVSPFFLKRSLFISRVTVTQMSQSCIWCMFPPGGALVAIGESMKKLSAVKDSLDIDVKQNFIDPLLQGVVEKDIKDIQVHAQ